MRTNQLLDEALAIARWQGYEVRHEHLGGSGTGYCQLGTRRWIILDVAQSEEEQLKRVAEAIEVQGVECSEELKEVLQRVGG